MLGTLLVSDGFRRWWPGWHRVLGRMQVLAVVGLGIKDEDRLGVFDPQPFEPQLTEGIPGTGRQAPVSIANW